MVSSNSYVTSEGLPSKRKGNGIGISAIDPIPGSRSSIIVSILTCHAGKPGSIPCNGALCQAIVMSNPEGYDPRLRIRGILRTLETRGKLNINIGPPHRILGGRCSIVVSIPTCHVGDPGLIPGNGAWCRAIVMSHSEAHFQGFQYIGYSVQSE